MKINAALRKTIAAFCRYYLLPTRKKFDLNYRLYALIFLKTIASFIIMDIQYFLSLSFISLLVTRDASLTNQSKKIRITNQ